MSLEKVPEGWMRWEGAEGAWGEGLGWGITWISIF